MPEEKLEDLLEGVKPEEMEGNVISEPDIGLVDRIRNNPIYVLASGVLLILAVVVCGLTGAYIIDRQYKSDLEAGIAQATRTAALVTEIPTYAPTEVIIPTSIPVPPTPTYTNEPTNTPRPTNTPTPKPVTNVITVWSAEENGMRVDINAAGMYEFTYLGDAYSPWPNEQYPGYKGWTTILRIYVNRSVEWGITEYGLEGPINYDAYLGPGEYYLSKEDAIAVSNRDRRTFRLNAGDYLTLVTLDERGQYIDNRGKIDVGVTYLGP